MTSDIAFLPIAPADEFLHPAHESNHYTAIETNYYGFHLPEQAIDGHIYVWFHTALKVMGIFIFVYRGHKGQQLEAEYFNHHDFLPMVESNADYTHEMGSGTIRIRVEKPLEEIRITIDDPGADFRLDMRSRGVVPAVGRPGGKHLTQLMRNEGELVLRGEAFPLSGHFVRDRSWSQLRGEAPQAGPPACWMTGIFGDDLAFHTSILDTGIFDLPEFGPAWTDTLPIDNVLRSLKWESGGDTANMNLRGGWWYDGQGTRKIVEATKTTQLAADGLTTIGCTLDLLDDQGERHVMTGTSLGGIQKMYGQNMVVYLNQIQWTLGDRTGVGSMQTVYFNDHLYKHKIRQKDVA